jgi:hypothetical protein
MPISPSCLTGLIGLSRAASPCFPLPLGDTAFITASASGLYLDEVEGLNLRPAPLQTAGADAWARFDKARTQAVAYVDNDLGKRMTLGTPLEQPAGTLGGLGDGTLAPLGTPAVLTLPLTLKPSLGWQLLSVALYTDVTAADVPVYLDNVLIGTLTTNGGLFAPVPNAAMLLRFDGQTHTLRAELPEGVRPKNNRLTCGCGNPWVKAVAAALLPGTNTKQPAGGFVVQVQQVCTALAPLCHAITQDAELAKSVAFAVLYKTAELTVVSLLADAQYSRYTSLDAKALEGLIARYTGLYEEHQAWLLGGTGLARVAQPCYGCAPAAFSYTKSR